MAHTPYASHSLRPRLARLQRLLLASLLACVTSGSVSIIDEVVAADTQASLPLAAHGTPFYFEVIESQDSKYLGDTPAHKGKDGDLTVRPNIALGDHVYRTTNTATVITGRVTHVLWDRVSGSLTVEFYPEPLQRIAVGDEVWVDLNPDPAKPRTGGGPTVATPATAP